MNTKPKDFNLLLRSIGSGHLADYADRPLLEMWQAKRRTWEPWDYRISINVPEKRYFDFQNGTSVSDMVPDLGLWLDFDADMNGEEFESICIWQYMLSRKATLTQRECAEALQLRAYREFVAAVHDFRKGSVTND